MIYSEDKSIGIRAIEKLDLPIIQSWRNNDNIRQYFREYREFSMTQKENWYEAMLSDNRFEMFVIVEVGSQKLIGVAGLTYIDWINRHADVHFYIGEGDSWIDEVFAPKAIPIVLEYGYHTLNLNKLWTEIYEIDTKKLAFFEQLGFKVDANLREHYFHNGKYYTSHILSLLCREYSNE